MLSDRPNVVLGRSYFSTIFNLLSHPFDSKTKEWSNFGAICNYQTSYQNHPGAKPRLGTTAVADFLSNLFHLRMRLRFTTLHMVHSRGGEVIQ